MSEITPEAAEPAADEPEAAAGDESGEEKEAAEEAG